MNITFVSHFEISESNEKGEHMNKEKKITTETTFVKRPVVGLYKLRSKAIWEMDAADAWIHAIRRHLTYIKRIWLLHKD